jgi:anti-sigma regulatory factor (Ser/Thr protein kinase)
MSQLLQKFDRFISAHPRCAEVRGDVALALDELVSNVVRHGYDHEEEDEDEHGDHMILVGIAVEAHHLEVQIIDDAHCFSPLEVAAPAFGESMEDRPMGGLGIYLVRSLMDEVEYRRSAGRNHLVLRKRLPS